MNWQDLFLGKVEKVFEEQPEKKPQLLKCIKPSSDPVKSSFVEQSFCFEKCKTLF